MSREENVPAELVKALRGSGAAVELEYDGAVYTVTGSTVALDAGRIYWPMEDFLALLGDAAPAAQPSVPNPDTGANDVAALAAALAAVSLLSAGVLSLRRR